MAGSSSGKSHRRNSSSVSTSVKGTPKSSISSRSGIPQAPSTEPYNTRSRRIPGSPPRRSKHAGTPTTHKASRTKRDDFSDGGSVSLGSFNNNERRELISRRRERTSKSLRDESPSRAYDRKRESSPFQLGKYPGVKKAVDDLNQAIGHHNRISTIANACEEFDHWDEKKHAAELSYGAANVLSLVLSMTADDDEVRLICAALEMIFRASQRTVKIAFVDIGAAVVPILLRLLDRCENGTMKNADVSILSITKTLLYISRVSELRNHLARQQGMLDALVRVATSILNADCRIARTRIIANLANCDANKVLMFEHQGLLESIMRIAALDLSDSAREYAGAALMDLASSPANQVPMANIDKVLGTLVKLAVVENVDVTRESAVTSLQNLAFAKDNRVRLVSYSSGVVLEALKKTVSGDSNDKARRRAAGALTNLACEETAERMGNHKGLLETLAVVSTKDSCDDVQTRASLALTKVAASITVQMSCHETLLDSLVVASLSASANSVSAVLRVKARDPENRESMARHPGILDTLADICVSLDYNVKDRENAMRALMHLTNEGSNVKIMCNKTILDALVTGACLEGSKFEGVRESAIVAMERLATEFSNRKSLAHHDGLLVAVAKATEREAKLELSGNESGQALLAKPLLMSLLVAM